LTPPGIRYQASRKARQDEIWGSIRSSSEKLSVKSKTEDFQSVYEDRKVRRDLDEYRKAFRPIWRPQPAGIVVCRFGRIVGAELFGGGYLFSRLQHKILDSYILDRLHYPLMERFPNVSTNDVERFLNRVYRARFTYGTTPGEGRSVSVSGTVNGSALSLGGVAVHLNLFEGVTIMPHR